MVVEIPITVCNRSKSAEAQKVDLNVSGRSFSGLTAAGQHTVIHDPEVSRVNII